MTRLVGNGGGATTAIIGTRQTRRSYAPDLGLAPTTTVVLPNKSRMIVLFLCVSMVSRGLHHVASPPFE